MGVDDLDKRLLNRHKGNPVHYSESRFEPRNGCSECKLQHEPSTNRENELSVGMLSWNITALVGDCIKD